ncbi:hypothetical protein GQ105_003400 [Salmonella enterica]|nr:hypothetical protein [Salmonella enterica]
MNEDMRLFFDDWITEQDQKVVGEQLVDLFIKYNNNDKALLLYSEVLSRMNIDDFSYTLRYHMKQYRNANVVLSREDKAAITLSILNKIKCYESIDFDEYRSIYDSYSFRNGLLGN